MKLTYLRPYITPFFWAVVVGLVLRYPRDKIGSSGLADGNLIIFSQCDVWHHLTQLKSNAEMIIHGPS